jgi:predicted metal-binding protein
MKKACKPLPARAVELGARDARVIDTPDIVFDDRSFLKCRFGCNRWGRYWTCPPHLAISQEQFMAAFNKYDKAIIIESGDPKIGQDVTLAVEKEAMLVCGSMFAFAMVLCVQCEKCAYPEPCNYPHMARPSMDAYGIDIAKTIEPLGFQVTFDREGKLIPSWYSMVLL